MEGVYGVSFSSFSAPDTVKDTYGKTGKDPEAGGLVLSVLSPCLLPYPALPALPRALLLSLFFSFWEGERMESGLHSATSWP